MKKTRLTERFQQLAGIKPLYENEDGKHYRIMVNGLHDDPTGEYPVSKNKAISIAKKMASGSDKIEVVDETNNKVVWSNQGGNTSVNEDLGGLMAQGEKMAAFANKQSGYEGGVSSPVRGVLAAMTAAGAPDFDGDEELKSYWTRRLTKAIETQKGRKYMSGFSEEVNEIDESATQYLSIINSLYPGKSWEELTPSERFKVRSTYEDFN